MFCHNCGKKLPDEATFCVYCGVQVAPSEPVNQNEPARRNEQAGAYEQARRNEQVRPNEPVRNARSNRKLSGLTIALIASVAVFLVALLVAVCVVLVPKLSSASNSGTASEATSGTTSGKSETSEENAGKSEGTEDGKQGAGTSENTKPELYQVITKTMYTEERDGSTGDSTRIEQYGDNGLLVSVSEKITLGYDDDAGTFCYDYEYDEKGYPVRVWVPADEEYSFAIDIENVMEDGKIREAVLSFSDEMKEYFSEEDLTDGNSSVDFTSFVTDAMKTLEGGTMYENAVLRFDFSDAWRIEKQDGVTVLHSFKTGNIIVKLEYDSTGRMLSQTTIMADTGEIEYQEFYSYDGDRISSVSRGEEVVELEYTESQDPETGEKILTGEFITYYYSADGVLLRTEKGDSDNKTITFYQKNGKEESYEYYRNQEDTPYRIVYIIRSADDSRVEDISDLEILPTIRVDRAYLDSEGLSSQTTTSEAAQAEPAVRGADRVEFEYRYTSGNEGAVIRAYAGSDLLWERSTGSYPGAQLSRVGEIGIHNNMYYYYEEESVYALSLVDGSVIWQNTEASAPSMSCVFDDNGNLILTGTLSMLLMGIDPNGNTLFREQPGKDKYMWPGIVGLEGNQVRMKVTRQDASMKEVEILVNLSDFSITEQ